MKDEKIIDKIQKGETELFDSIIRKYYQSIYRFCFYYLDNEQDSLDVTQDVFVKVYESLQNYDNKGKFKNYLYVIAKNKCKDILKKRTPISLAEIDLPLVRNPIMDVENEIAVQQALHELSDKEKEIVILRFYQELKYRDIAEIMKIGIPHVEYYVKSAMKKMKKYMEGGEKR